MSFRAAFLCLAVSLSGCMSPALVTFPPARQVTSILIHEGPAEENPEQKTIRDPRKIGEILAFLRKKEGNWEQSSIAPDIGQYHVAFVGEDIRMFLRTGNGAMQVQGGDYTCHYKDLSEEDQRTLLRLLSIDPANAKRDAAAKPAASKGASDKTAPAGDDFIEMP